MTTSPANYLKIIWINVLIYLCVRSSHSQTRMQSLHPEPGARYRNVMDALQQIVRTEGVWRPIRGVNVLAVGAGPAHALYFACYEKIKFSLSDAIHPGANSHFANGKMPTQIHAYKPNTCYFSTVRLTQIVNSITAGNRCQ